MLDFIIYFTLLLRDQFVRLSVFPTQKSMVEYLESWCTIAVSAI